MDNMNRPRICAVCKVRKRRCNGENPCSACVRSHQQCTYVIASDKRRRKYHTDYIDSLESRSTRLMTFIDEFVQDDEALKRSVGERLKALNEKDISARQSSPSVESNDFFDDELAALVEDTSNLRLDYNYDSDDGPNEHNGAYKDNALTSELQQQILKRCELFQNDPITDDSSPVALVGLTLLFTDASYQQTLMDLFHQKCSIHSMFVHELIPMVRHMDYNSLEDPKHKNLLNVIFGIASKFSLHPQAPIHESYFIAIARDSLMAVIDHCKVNIFTIASIHLLSWYEMGQGDLFQSYLLNSMCCSLSQHMGLHISYDDDRYAPRQTPFNSAALWSVCTHDRMITSAISVPSVIHFKRIISPLYYVNSQVDDAIHLQELTFAYIARIWYIFDRFTDQIFSVNFDLGEINNRMTVLSTAQRTFTDLYHSLPLPLRLNHPLELRLSTQNDLLVLLFHFNYHMVSMELNKIFIRKVATPSLRKSMLFHASHAGELIHLIVEQRDSIDIDLLPHYLPHFINVISLVYLFILYTSTIDEDSFYQHYEDSKELLRLMSLNWRMARLSLDNLQVLEGKYMKSSPERSSALNDVKDVSTNDIGDASVNRIIQEFPDFEEILQSYKTDPSSFFALSSGGTFEEQVHDYLFGDTQALLQPHNAGK